MKEKIKKQMFFYLFLKNLLTFMKMHVKFIYVADERYQVYEKLEK